MGLSQEHRRTLVRQVERQVAGRGISRREVEDAVERVARALDARAPHPASSSVPARGAACACGAQHAPDAHAIIAVLAASSMPDLASRARQLLAGEGVEPRAVAAASVGRHTVVTLGLTPSEEPAVRSIAARLGASCSIQPGEGTR